MPLTTLVAGQTARAAHINANYALCMLTDTSRTCTVTHTYTASQTFTGGFTTGAAATLGGNLLFTDATYDIGASGATRPRDLFLSRNAVVPGTLTLAGATVAGTPTWSSSQAITLSTAAQPNVTSVGTLTSLTVTGFTTLNGVVEGARIIRTRGFDETGSSGAGAEMQLSGGIAQFQGFDRTTAAFIETRVRGLSAALYASTTERIKVNGTGIGFFATAPVARPTGVAVSAGGIHAALVTLGLITA